jgi:hypothetical protein
VVLLSEQFFYCPLWLCVVFPLVILFSFYVLQLFWSFYVSFCFTIMFSVMYTPGDGQWERPKHVAILNTIKMVNISMLFTGTLAQGDDVY